MNPRDFILSRSGSVRRTREGYWAYWPNPLPPQFDWSPALLAILSAAERSLGELTATLRLTPSLDFWLPLLNAREACRSCQIDGLEAELSNLLHAQCLPGSRYAEQDEIIAAANYSQALQLFAQEPPFSLAALTQSHARLFPQDPMQTEPASEFRTEQNWIGPPGSTLDSAVFIPPPPDRILRALEQLAEFINTGSALPHLIALGLFHYQYEALHPFMSGNGRLGRILISNLPALQGDLPGPILHPSGYLLTHRREYFDLLLAVSQRSVWEDWLVFFLRAIAASAQHSIQTLGALENFETHYRQVLSTFRTGVRLGRLLDFVLEHPFFTVRQVESALGVNFAVAQRYVNQLEGLGIVDEITGQARNRIYRVPGILDLLKATKLGQV